MMVFIIGGSGSGKSAYAENVAVSLAAGGQQKKYYLATMRSRDEEDRKRIKQHRKLRSKKGFITIEQPMDIEQAIGHIRPGGHVALLECISNLLANEMFREETPKSEEQVTGKIMAGILALNQKLSDLVIVGNQVFQDGIIYPETTMGYIRAMGAINQEIAAMADEVVEVVVGIPIIMKPWRTGREVGH